jgi:hypothetical protein
MSLEFQFVENPELFGRTIGPVERKDTHRSAVADALATRQFLGSK